MTPNGWLQILFFLLALFLVTPLIGGYMARVFARQRTWLDPVVRPIERLMRLWRADPLRVLRQAHLPPSSAHHWQPHRLFRSLQSRLHWRRSCRGSGMLSPRANNLLR